MDTKELAIQEFETRRLELWLRSRGLEEEVKNAGYWADFFSDGVRKSKQAEKSSQDGI